MNVKLLSILNLVGLIIVLVMNGLANALPINGRTTGELSDQYPNLFVPAGLTFSIWGVIYLLLILFVFYQLSLSFGKQRKEENVVERIGWLFFISCMANSSWIVAWHYERVGLSVIIMFILLVSLILIYQRLNIGMKGIHRGRKWMIHVPFSIYLGWITIATIANITALLVDIGWTGWGIPEVYWTILMLSAGTLITLVMIFRRGDFFYSLVVLWAFLGIVLKRSGGTTSGEDIIMYTAVTAMAVIMIGAVYKMFMRSASLSS